MLVARIDVVAENQYGEDSGDTGVFADFLLVLFEESYAVLNLERDLISL